MANLGLVDDPFGERKKRHINSVKEKILVNKKKKYSGQTHEQRNGKIILKKQFHY